VPDAGDASDNTDSVSQEAAESDDQ
jgi:hypothetical protein